MRRIPTILIIVFISICESNAQQLGFGAQYRIPDSEHQNWIGAQLFFEVDLSERSMFDFNFDIMLLTVEITETNAGENFISRSYTRSRSPVFGVGALLNYSLYHLNDHFEVLAGAGVMFYSLFKIINTDPDGGTGIFGRTDLQTALTLRYNQIADSQISIFVSARPSLMLQSDSHFETDKYVGRQNNMVGLHAGLIFDLE